MREPTSTRGLRTARKDSERRGKLKKTKNRNTRFGIASVHRKPNLKAMDTVKPVKKVARKKTTRRQTATGTKESIAAARSVSTTDTSVVTVATATSEKTDRPDSTTSETAPAVTEAVQDSNQTENEKVSDAVEKTQAKPVTVVTATQNTAHPSPFPWRRILIGGLLAFIGLLGYRHWFSDQDTEEAALAATSKAPVATARTIASTPKVPRPTVAAVPGTTAPPAGVAAPSAPAQQWQYRPLTETDETQPVEATASAVAKPVPAVPSVIPSPAVAQPATAPAPAQVPNNPYQAPQQNWQQPWHRSPGYPGYQYRYR
jgi:hypothetical protein